MKRIAYAVMIVGMALSATNAMAQSRVQVNPRRNPNIAQAQALINQAYQYILAAQRQNEFDMGGHAERAKELLDQANVELKRAAITANHR